MACESEFVDRAKKGSAQLKFILNCLLYAAQWLHLRMGGEIEVQRDRIILHIPKGRHVHCTNTVDNARLKAVESQDTDA